jgi:hypothetical protein
MAVMNLTVLWIIGLLAGALLGILLADVEYKRYINKRK